MKKGKYLYHTCKSPIMPYFPSTFIIWQMGKENEHTHHKEEVQVANKHLFSLIVQPC